MLLFPPTIQLVLSRITIFMGQVNKFKLLHQKHLEASPHLLCQDHPPFIQEGNKSLVIHLSSQQYYVVHRWLYDQHCSKKNKKQLCENMLQQRTFPLNKIILSSGNITCMQHKCAMTMEAFPWLVHIAAFWWWQESGSHWTPQNKECPSTYFDVLPAVFFFCHIGKKVWTMLMLLIRNQNISPSQGFW